MFIIISKALVKYYIFPMIMSFTKNNLSTSLYNLNAMFLYKEILKQNDELLNYVFHLQSIHVLPIRLN